MRRADIAVHGRDGDLALAVEVKNRMGASPAWARDLRRNLLEAQALPASTFFMIALPDVLYLWAPGSVRPEALPDYAISTERVLAPYLRSLGRPVESLSYEGFRLLVTSWLQDLASTRVSAEDPTDRDWLHKSGLMSTLHQGDVAIELAV